MRVSALTVTVSMMIGLSFFGCATPPVPPQFGGVAAPSSQSVAACTLPKFLSKVHFLATSPPFSLPSSGFQNAPPIDTVTPVDPNGTIASDLMGAFNMAPDFFKNQLCNLTGIYIDRTGCSGYDPSSCGSDPAEPLWGFRAFDSSGHSAGEFIGTWLGLWKKGALGHAPLFSKFETGRLQTLLNWTSSNPPVHLSANPDTASMTVLAVLAHEVGHIFWYDVFVVNANGSPHPGGPADFSKFCGGTFYSGVGDGQSSWALPVDVSPNRWVYFGQVRNRHAADDVRMAPFGFALARKQFPDAGERLHGLYSGPRWASALAAFSPDEDFVETFQLYVLMNAGTKLRSSQVKIFGIGGRIYLDDIPANFGQKPELIRKTDCFEKYFRPGP